MSEEGFFHRWARLKSRGGAGQPVAGPAVPLAPPGNAPELPAVAQTAPHPPVGPPPAAPGQSRQLPTLQDVALLTSDSDFSAFVAQGVDKTVQRLAMKKLFLDPHFNLMDGLDTYIDDYTKPDPLPAAMRASLRHANSVFAQFLENENKASKNASDGKDDTDGNDPAGPSREPEPPAPDNP